MVNGEKIERKSNESKSLCLAEGRERIKDVVIKRKFSPGFHRGGPLGERPSSSHYSRYKTGNTYNKKGEEEKKEHWKILANPSLSSNSRENANIPWRIKRPGEEKSLSFLLLFFCPSFLLQRRGKLKNEKERVV